MGVSSRKPKITTILVRKCRQRKDVGKRTFGTCVEEPTPLLNKVDWCCTPREAVQAKTNLIRRINGRSDLLWPVTMLARSVTNWNNACEKKAGTIDKFRQPHEKYRQHKIPNPLQAEFHVQCVPISWVCKKQAAVSRMGNYLSGSITKEPLVCCVVRSRPAQAVTHSCAMNVFHHVGVSQHCTR